jgi:hypothetical protein
MNEVQAPYPDGGTKQEKATLRHNLFYKPIASSKAHLAR